MKLNNTIIYRQIKVIKTNSTPNYQYLLSFWCERVHAWLPEIKLSHKRASFEFSPCGFHSQLRFGQLNKDYSNTNVFEHSGKFYSVSENHIPQEIDIFTLNTLKYWDVNGAWNRPFASHPKVSFTCNVCVVYIQSKQCDCSVTVSRVNLSYYTTIYTKVKIFSHTLNYCVLNKNFLMFNTTESSRHRRAGYFWRRCN